MKKILRNIKDWFIGNFNMIAQVTFLTMVIGFYGVTLIENARLKQLNKLYETSMEEFSEMTNKMKANNEKNKNAIEAIKDEFATYELLFAKYKYDAENLKVEYDKTVLENKELKKEIASLKKAKVVNVKPKVINNYKPFSYAMHPSKYNVKSLSKGDIDLVLEYSKKYKIDPHLVVAVIWYESRFDTKTKSKYSSASGYGQFIKSTGKWVYNDLLKRKDTYDHEVHPFQAKNSIPMVYAYLDFLIKRNKGDIKKVLIRYNGGELGNKYHDDINTYFKNVNSGTDLEKIELQIKKNYNYIL